MTREYYSIVRDILENEEFKKRKNYEHHGDISVYDHSLRVSIISYNVAKKLNLDYKSAAIGGLLHDFYFTPWKDKPDEKEILKKHGFAHAKEAFDNSKNHFPELVDDKVGNIILRHMFPLNITPPKYKEAWLITLIDKYVSLETLKKPEFFLRIAGYELIDVEEDDTLIDKVRKLSKVV